MHDPQPTQDSPKPPFGLPFFVAHTPPKEQDRSWHSLEKHAIAVADLAEGFAHDALGAEAAPWGRYLGLIHDLGKFRVEFQTYLWNCFDRERRGGNPPPPGSAAHKQAGARAALMALPGFGQYLATALQGHHYQMESLSETPRAIAKEKSASEIEVRALLKLAAGIHSDLAPTVPDIAPLMTESYVGPADARELFLRILYSCLTDADGLDTEAHFDPAAAALREKAFAALPTMAVMRDQLQESQARDFAIAEATTVNEVRKDVYAACSTKAIEMPPGVFSLTVPTGGGKTRSSLAFALEHAVQWEKRRVIYAIPYTSIVDQTADVFRGIFGDVAGVVLEHHSGIEPSDGDHEISPEYWRRLATQNWDAPLIVTTTVQLFESLFSNRPGKCRKLHNICGSVLVLDEVQTLPVSLLQPLLDCLRLLTEHFGVTVVLCTATQPALEGNSRWLSGFSRVRPIVESPDRHFELLKRVTYQVEDEPWDAQQVAARMTAEREADRSCLCIMNTRRDALAILDALDPDGEDSDDPAVAKVLHLSTLLCGRHRRAVLDSVKRRLKHGPPVLLVATTVIECGVDVDFSTVLRALGPLDRILQSAGRCNREGLRPVEESLVIVFRFAEGRAPRGAYSVGLSETEDLFRKARESNTAIAFESPDFVTTFFASLYRTLGKGQMDAESVLPYRDAYDYPEVAKRVRLIKDETVSVLITNCPGGEADAQAIVAQADAIGRMSRELWQKASALSVSLYSWDADPEKTAVDEVVPGFLVWRGKYDVKRGVPLLSDPADAVVHKPTNLFG